MAISNGKKPISLTNLDVFREEITDEILSRAETLNTAAEEAKNKAEIARSAALSAGAAEAAFTLPSADWTALDRTYGDYKYSAEITLNGITSGYTCNVIFDMESIEAAVSFRIASTCGIDTDKVIVYAKNEIDRELTGVIVYGQCENASGIGRTNVSFKNTYVPYGGAWDNCVMTDDNGNTSTMVRIPKMTWKELGVGDSDEVFPAFIVNGSEVSALWVGKYIATGGGRSVKGAAPKTTINFDDSYALCKSMGEGWHLNTRLTWMAAALWSAKHNRQPEVTTNAGATGNMDVSHSHNGLESGIWDMAGCKYEWNAGMRLVQGELQIISSDGKTFDNSAVVLDSSATSPNWYCINALTGELIKPNGSGTTTNSLKISKSGQWSATASDGSYSNTIDSVKVASNVCEKAKNMLIALGMMLPEGVTTDGDHAYLYKEAEYVPFVGGCSGYGARAGVFCVVCPGARSYANADVGLRAAFCEL
ncbi:MAG: hypothetical protein NC401_18955 [Ruminococcus sp.]|nr:hypothetical protein [Ruminococcus sp.]